MRAWKVAVEIEPWAEGGFIARAPALQGCWVVADTAEEAIRDIYEGIELSIESRLKHGEPLPPDLEEIHNDAGGAILLDLAVAVA